MARARGRGQRLTAAAEAGEHLEAIPEVGQLLTAAAEAGEHLGATPEVGQHLLVPTGGRGRHLLPAGGRE